VIAAPSATPSATVPPTPEPAGEPIRIQFAPGGTSATLHGTIAPPAAGGVTIGTGYVLRAQAGQTMTVEITSPNGQVLLTVIGADGTVFKRFLDGSASWTGTLPRTQDYYVKPVAVGQDATYTLHVSIPPLSPTPTTEAGPVRIQFAPGATSATVHGTIEPPETGGVTVGTGYVLRAQAGQTMEADIDSAHGDILLSIVGADGQPLKRYHVGGAYWQGTLPETQDYILRPVAIGQDDSYMLTVTIPPAIPEPTEEPSAPTRIQFAPGATSATVHGTIDPPTGGGVNVGTGYVLRAQAGQTMIVDITSPGGEVLFKIVGSDGIPLKRYVDGTTHWSGTLPVTQDYYIEPVAVGQDGTYTLEISIPPLGPEPARIEFAPGANATTVDGSFGEAGVRRYVLRALAGQEMTVRVWPASDVHMAVQGADGSYWEVPLGQSALHIAELPRTQDYVIILWRAPDATVIDFTMQVSIVY
jgi:hypothetical protein